MNDINIDELPEGGRGIKIMYQIADDLIYHQTPDGRNCLLLVKKLPVSAPNRSNSKTWKEKAMDILNQDISLWFRPELSKMDSYPSNSIYVKQISLRTKSQVEAVPDVLKWYEDLEFFISDKTVWWQCQIAVIEAFTNAVRHAHKNLPVDTPIDLEITIFTDRIEMRVWDFGMPFDMATKLQEIQDKEAQNLARLDTPLTVAYNFS